MSTPKRVLDCSPIQPALKRSSTSKAPESSKQVSFSAQALTKPPKGHHDVTRVKVSISRLDSVDVCGSGDVVPSPVSKTNSMDNREKSATLPFLKGSTSNNSKGVQFQTAFSHYSTKSGEGNKQTILPTYPFLKNAPAVERAWSGIVEVDFGGIRVSQEMTAHLSAKVSRKAYEFSKKFNPELHFKLLPRSECYPRIFQDSCPNRDDIALYFYPARVDGQKQKYSGLLKHMVVRDLMMRSCIDGIELLMFPSTILSADSQRINNSDFIWGVFRRGKDEI